jgi:DNA-binding IclR family transcriptional regulator
MSDIRTFEVVMKNDALEKSVAISNLNPGSLNRAVILLRAIAQGSRRGSLLTDLVAKTALPRPTIHRVMDQLMEIGWVVRDKETARFNLGMDLAALGYSAISRNPLERIASTHLAMLAEKLNQVVYLGVRSGLDMICIGRYESDSQIQVGKGRIGLRMPFGTSPSCMAMLAKLPETEVQEIIRANLSRYHRIEGFDEHGFRIAVGETIKTGYSTYDGIILDRTTSGLGVPICDPEGYPVAGIGTTYITSWLDDKQWKFCLTSLLETAELISKDLFYGTD